MDGAESSQSHNSLQQSFVYLAEKLTMSGCHLIGLFSCSSTRRLKCDIDGVTFSARLGPRLRFFFNLFPTN